MTQSSFELVGDVDFAPFYCPNRFRVKKSRNLDRQENFCGREDVTDLGAKNREVHIAGLMREPEIAAFKDVQDASTEFTIVTPGWKGRVFVEDSEYEGPNAIDPHSGNKLYKYTLDLVSTGEDESQSTPEPALDTSTIDDPALDITFEEIYTRAGVNPTDEQIEIIEEDAHYPFYIASRNYTTYARLVDEDLSRSDENASNPSRAMIDAAKDLVSEYRGRVISDIDELDSNPPSWYEI